MKGKTSISKTKAKTSGKPRKLSSPPVASLAPSPVLGEGGGEGILGTNTKPTTVDLYHSIATILRTARANAYRAINFTMVEAYWNVGRTIVEDEQRGENRAEYGAALLKNLAARLTQEFGKGFTETNLKYFRQFYQAFPPQGGYGIRHTLCDQLNWSHYRVLMRVESADARAWYLKEAVEQNWSVRALERQINSLYYQRLLMSKDKAPVTNEMRDNTAPLSATPKDFIKDPYVLEFLGIPDAHQFREAELEQAIIDKLQTFMLELGKGFAFVGRQYRVSTQTKDSCRSILCTDAEGKASCGQARGAVGALQ